MSWKTYIKETKSLLKNDKKIMRLNEFIGMKETKIIIAVLYLILGNSIVNYIINSCKNLPEYLANGNPEQYFGIGNIFFDFKQIFAKDSILPFIYLIALIFFAISTVVLIYKIDTYIGMKSINKGQKGVERWTALSEIKEQYKEIPDTKIPFPGRGGIPVCEYKDKLYIDDGAVNNLILGITRSGKGEMFVYKVIDILSRALEKASMIIGDLKLDQYPACHDELVNRGYDVYLLNLIDPLYSMGFDPLEIIVQAWEEGREDDAEDLCLAFAYSIYNPSTSANHGNDKFWASNGVSSLTACILAQMDDCLKEDKEVNEKRLSMWLHKQELYKKLPENEKVRAKEVYEEYMEKGKDVLVSVKYIPDNIDYVPTDENKKKINMYSIIVTFSALAQETVGENLTKLDLFFTQRPFTDRARLKYSSVKVAGDRTKGSIFSSTLTELGVFMNTKIAKMTAENTLNFLDIGYGEKPVAIFIGLPEYDKSKHFIATIFIRQIYYILAQEATKRRSQKCTREVIFYLAEVGNMPPIENLANIITMCLSRNIRFYLEIQSFSQISKLYGDDAETIIGNCANQVFIKTQDEATAKKFSSMLGNQTVINISRTGSKLSLKKSITENTEEKPLLNMNELMNIKEGECVIRRVLKNRDLQGKKITNTPIYNNVEDGTDFKYRYQYMLDVFPDDKIYTDIEIETRDHIDLGARVWDSEKSFQRLLLISTTFEEISTYEMIMNLLNSLLEDDELDMYGIVPDMPVTQLIETIKVCKELPNHEIETILYLIESGC